MQGTMNVKYQINGKNPDVKFFSLFITNDRPEMTKFTIWK